MRNIILTVVAVLISLTAFAQEYFGNCANEDGFWLNISKGTVTVQSSSPTIIGLVTIDNLVETEYEMEWSNGDTTIHFFTDDTVENAKGVVWVNLDMDDTLYQFYLFKNRKKVQMADFEEDLKL